MEIVATAIHKPKNNKTSGLDENLAELLKRGSDVIATKLAIPLSLIITVYAGEFPDD